MKKAALFITKLRKQDIFKIMRWRNNQINILRQNTKLTRQDQIKYYNKIKKDSKKNKPKNMLFSIINSNDQNCIGYGGLVNIDWQNKKAEMSFLLDTKIIRKDDQYNLYFNSFIKLIKKEFFKVKLNRLFTETFLFRKKHIKVLEKNNFVKEGILRKNTFKKKYIDSIIHSIVKGKN